MRSTSLHKIVTKKIHSQKNHDIARLFVSRQLPSFHLAELKSSELMSNDSFSSLVRLLEAWNRNASSPMPNSQSLFAKNEFVYRTLKTVALKGAPQIGYLEKVCSWYSQNSRAEDSPVLRSYDRQADMARDWEIRSNYKSNLPFEIDNYKRRFLFTENASKENKENVEIDISVDTGNNFLDTLAIETAKKTQILTKTKQRMLRFNIENCKKNDIHHKFATVDMGGIKLNLQMAKNRQQQQFAAHCKMYTISRLQTANSRTKNFYKKAFDTTCKDVEIERKSSKRAFKQKINDFEGIKEYRVKTAVGFRKKENTVQDETVRFFNEDLYRCNKNVISSQAEPCLSEDRSKYRTIVGIDGVSLISNPLEGKMKKKKK